MNERKTMIDLTTEAGRKEVAEQSVAEMQRKGLPVGCAACDIIAEVLSRAVSPEPAKTRGTCIAAGMIKPWPDERSDRFVNISGRGYGIGIEMSQEQFGVLRRVVAEAIDAELSPYAKLLEKAEAVVNRHGEFSVPMTELADAVREAKKP